MRPIVALALIAASGASACGDDPPSSTIDAPPGGGSDASGPDAPIFNPLDGIGNVEVVQAGYMFTEGPQWREATGDLIFSDIPANTVYRYTPGGGAPVIHRMPSGNTNGNALDNAGLVIAAQHGTRSVTRDGTAIATTFEGSLLNSPNDVIVATDGTIYFTDPPYGISMGQWQLNFMGVFRIDTQGTLTAEHRGATTERPNGIGLSPDGLTLYVADSGNGQIHKFTVTQPGGALTARTMFAQTSGGADGLAIDIQGNVFQSATAGVEVWKPDGTKWGTIPVPKKATNCAFGGADHKTLYITAQDTLYRVQLANPGLPRN